jgi:hypothetical protein
MRPEESTPFRAGTDAAALLEHRAADPSCRARSSGDTARLSHLLMLRSHHEAALRRRQREIDRLRDELADVIRHDPTSGQDAWGRTA